MKKEILLSGIGGQGIIHVGEILCAAAVRAGYNVTFSPVYGAEKRGGRTMCNIVISTEVECQIVSEADIMLIMDDASLKDYQYLAGEKGVLIINSVIEEEPNCPCKNIKRVNFIQEGMDMGNARVASMIILGYLLKYLEFVPYDLIEEEVKKSFAKKPALMDLNMQALKNGYEHE